MKPEKSSNTLQAFWVAMGGLSSFGVAIVSSAILSRYFDKAEYGTYRQIIYIYNTLLLVFAAGLPRVFEYFLPRYSISQGKTIVYKISALLFFAGCIFSIFLYAFSGVFAVILKNHELTVGLKYFSPIPMLLLPTLGIEGIFSTYKKTIYIAVYNTLTRSLMLLCIVGAVIFFKGNYLYALYGWGVSSLLTLILAFYFKNIPFRRIKSNPADLKYKEIFSYSIPLVAASIAGIATKSADQFYISRFFGADVFAEFSNGFIQLPFVSMVTAAISTVLTPQFSRMIYADSDIDALVNLWKSAFIKSATILYPLIIFFIFNAETIITFLYSSNYKNSTIYFQLAMIVNFFNTVPFLPILLSMGKTKFYSKVHTFIGIYIWSMGYLSITIFNSPVYIAMISVSGSIIGTVVFWIYLSAKLNVSIFKFVPFRNVLIILFHSSVSMIFAILATNQLPLPSDLFKLILSFSFYLLFALTTSKFVNLNYLDAFAPILSKISPPFRRIVSKKR